MPTWMAVLLGVIVVLASAWRLTYTAARLDRLHARVEGSLSALDAQLVRRAEVSLELGGSGVLDAASSFLLIAAASSALECAEEALITDEVQERGIPDRRQEVEGELTDTLTAVCRQWNADEDGVRELRRRLGDACVRVELATRFHEDAIRDVRRVRGTWPVRLFRLAGHTALPQELGLEVHVEGVEPLAASW